MADVIALSQFEHGKTRKTGDTFSVSDSVAKQLKSKGLVELASAGKKQTPSQAPGKQSSASPAGQASPSKTAKQSGSGESKAQTGQ